MPTVMFVCTVNLCRSPIAEILFRKWLQRQHISGDWQVQSCGTWAVNGKSVATHVQPSLLALGIDLGQHRARNVTVELLAESDLVLCMTQFQREALHTEFPRFAGRIYLLSEMLGKTYDVPDIEDFVTEQYVCIAKDLSRIIEDAGKRILAMLKPASECS